MARVRDMLIEWIEKLSDESGYDFEELMELWFEYCDAQMEDEEPIDWDYFAGVTRERDW